METIGTAKPLTSTGENIICTGGQLLEPLSFITCSLDRYSCVSREFADLPYLGRHYLGLMNTQE